MRACKIGYCCDWGLSGKYCDGECMQVERFWEGVKGCFRVTAGPENAAAVEIVLRRTELSKMERVDTLYGPIDAPEISRTAFTTTQVVPRGVHVVLGSMASVGADPQGHDVFVLIGYFKTHVPE